MRKGLLIVALGACLIIMLPTLDVGSSFRPARTGSTVPVASSPVDESLHTLQDLIAFARACAQEAGISPDIFERQMQQESNFNPQALSSAGAQGIAAIYASDGTKPGG